MIVNIFARLSVVSVFLFIFYIYFFNNFDYIFYLKIITKTIDYKYLSIMPFIISALYSIVILTLNAILLIYRENSLIIFFNLIYFLIFSFLSIIIFSIFNNLIIPQIVLLVIANLKFVLRPVMNVITKKNENYDLTILGL